MGFQPMTCDTGAVLCRLSCQSNWKLVMLRVHNIPVDGEDVCECFFICFPALFKYMIHIFTCIFTFYELTTRPAWHWLNSPAVFFAQQDSIQKILLSLTSRIAETHLVHEKRRILSMYRLFVLLLLKDLSGGLGNTWAFFIRDVIYSLLRIISDETQSKKQLRQQQVILVVDDDLFLPCCNLIYYVCKAAVECCSQVGSIKANHFFNNTFTSLVTKQFAMCILVHGAPPWVWWCGIHNNFFAKMLLYWFRSVTGRL